MQANFAPPFEINSDLTDFAEVCNVYSQILADANIGVSFPPEDNPHLMPEKAPIGDVIYVRYQSQSGEILTSQSKEWQIVKACAKSIALETFFSSKTEVEVYVMPNPSYGFITVFS